MKLFLPIAPTFHTLACEIIIAIRKSEFLSGKDLFQGSEEETKSLTYAYSVTMKVRGAGRIDISCPVASFVGVHAENTFDFHAVHGVWSIINRNEISEILTDKFVFRQLLFTVEGALIEFSWPNFCFVLEIVIAVLFYALLATVVGFSFFT